MVGVVLAAGIVAAVLNLILPQEEELKEEVDVRESEEMERIDVEAQSEKDKAAHPV
jgi:hypothetical protein